MTDTQLNNGPRRPRRNPPGGNLSRPAIMSAAMGMPYETVRAMVAVDRMASRTVLANKYSTPIKAKMNPCRITARAGTFHVGSTAVKYLLNGIPPIVFDLV